MQHLDERWYKNAVVYAIDVEVFQDSDGDGIGDFQGLASRLDYLSHLGVDCLWLLPFYPSPNRDNGYDVADYYSVDSRHGTLGDFVDVVTAANERGIRVLVDLVVNHTSDEHPWFRKAREGQEPYKDYYVWIEDVEEGTQRAPGFPGEPEGDRVWTWDEEAGAYYYHRFYSFQPDLDLSNPDVREEIRKIMQFWLRLGISGFRLDAATLIIQEKRPGMPRYDDPFRLLRELKESAARYQGDVVFLAEADDALDRLAAYGEGGGGMDLLLNFPMSASLFAALGTERSDPLDDLVESMPALPEGTNWVNFLRNYDELNLSRLSPAYHDPVYERFAPDEGMRIYGRGLRRRVAPMFDGDQRTIELAFSLLFSLSGTPLLVYGDELGMGEDLSLPGRTAIRTPMQWSAEENAGFSTAPEEELVRPVISDGPFAYDDVNVADQWANDDSLLTFMEHLVWTRQETPEIGSGTMRVLHTEAASVFAHRFDDAETTVGIVHNLSDEPASVTLDVDARGTHLQILFGNGDVQALEDGGVEVDLDGYGFQWIRVRSERQ